MARVVVGRFSMGPFARIVLDVHFGQDHIQSSSVGWGWKHVGEVWRSYSLVRRRCSAYRGVVLMLMLSTCTATSVCCVHAIV